jgi:hypothetical protein
MHTKMLTMLGKLGKVKTVEALTEVIIAALKQGTKKQKMVKHIIITKTGAGFMYQIQWQRNNIK